MSASSYTEDTLVQQTTAEYLETQLGWESIYAFNNEDVGPNSLLGRLSKREVVLTRYLRRALVDLYPNLPDEAYDNAVRQLAETATNQSMVVTNRELYNLFRDGVKVRFTNDSGERKAVRLKVIDFAEPNNNHFLCVRELWVKGSLYRRRADLIGFVNGLPLLFIECKNIHRNLQAAFEENWSDYRENIPHLFHHNALLVVGNGDKAKLGSITSKWEHFHEWKRLEEDDPGVIDMETLLKGICNKSTLIDLFENFILFDDSLGKLIKIIARNHQYLGVNRAIESVRTREERDGKLGVFWHTQGSGKSYSMVFFTRKVHRKIGSDFTFLILTDRADLDSQIYKTFAGCRVVDHDKDPCRVSSGKALTAMLAQQKSHLFSLIKKFHQKIPNGDAVDERLADMMSKNPLRTDFQKHYEDIVAAYNSEKDRPTIEATFEALLKFVSQLDEEESRATREGLDEESLAIFDLIRKDELDARDMKRIKKVAAELLAKLKSEKLKIDQWTSKEATRDAVKSEIHDFLYADATGLPEPYSDDEIRILAANVFLHVLRAYPRLPSPIYTAENAA